MPLAQPWNPDALGTKSSGPEAAAVKAFSGCSQPEQVVSLLQSILAAYLSLVSDFDFAL